MNSPKITIDEESNITVNQAVYEIVVQYNLGTMNLYADTFRLKEKLFRANSLLWNFKRRR